ncbi:MAG TPA: hypothetical protein GX735_01355 [Firmicutes bacterium]|nr:hypothetical protein [Bacillota bacterium]
MNNVPFDSKDLSLILAIKPFLTPQGQKTIDGFISILEVLGRPAEASRKEKPDTQAVASLIRLLSEE